MADLFERVLMLKQTPTFAGVSTEDLRVIAQELVEEAYFAGERVFDIDDPSEQFYIVQAGEVGISIDPDLDSNRFLTVLGPGECFGELSLFDQQPRSATARIIEDTQLLALTHSKLRGLLMAYPELAFGLLRGLSLRLRNTNRRMT
ncbi:MAG: cyclic nucleotide-binding domain-containing protein [Burkholderiales bacterium]|nr:cyclic nucleotide-binding domain-containing protein [Burkholderiales bacterium]